MPRRRNLAMVDPLAGHWGAAMRDRREELDLSQVQVADRASAHLDKPIQQGMISRYETGGVQRTEPSIAAALEKALEMEPDTLMNLMGYGRGGRRLAVQAPPPGALVIGPDESDPLYHLNRTLLDWSDEDVARVLQVVELFGRRRAKNQQADEGEDEN